ncbi:MAG: lysine--tRNA ligase [Holosporales bacterium]|jgi:lysyl-tRNA synthetase class 1|nr:lysine--tRNA ligase [Holosporales bacterium]
MYKYNNSLKSWPFEEAQKVYKRINRINHNNKGYVLFETGYGPSGLPHIGTFGEVLRTTMVMHAFRRIAPEIPCKLFAFSDDMDGLRKVPTNVPNQSLLQENLEKPLTSIPDPFEKYGSFAEHNNAMLCGFLDSFGFEYEFKSSTEIYKSGNFNNALVKILENYEKIMEIMIPSLREERQKTYSPFLPICRKTGKVLQVPIKEIKLQESSVVYEDPETGSLECTSILDGHCKLQWKVDWGMRWAALGVDYEMSGKDLIDSVKLSSSICRVIGGDSPECLSYELFLDEEAKKISKSKGNGLSMEDWLKYAPEESLSYYMYQSPKRAKRLFFDVIPNAMDDYIDSVNKFYETDDDNKRMDSAVFHIHNGPPPHYKNCLKFSMLLNLVEACSTSDSKILFGFIEKYAEKYDYSKETVNFLEKLARYAVKYYKDFVEGKRFYKKPNDIEKQILRELVENFREDQNAEELQTIIFDMGKKYYKDDVKQCFVLLYEILFGTNNGPKMGSFISLYGVKNTIKLLKDRGELDC